MNNKVMTIRMMVFVLFFFFSPCLLIASENPAVIKVVEQQSCREENLFVDPTLNIAPEQFKPLLQQGEKLQDSGNTGDAIAHFYAALESAELSGDERRRLVALSALGNAYLLAGLAEKADITLSEALKTSATAGYQDLLLINSNHLASLAMSQGRKKEAEALYLQALSLAEKEQEKLLSCIIRVNLTKLAEPEKAVSLLKEAWAINKKLPEGPEKIVMLLALGHRATSLRENALAYNALESSRILAEKYGDQRQLSLVLGNLATLYEAANRTEEALNLAGQAIQQGQRSGAVDLLMKLEWQQARLQSFLGMQKQALGSYRRAISHLQAIRADIPVQYTNGRSSFRETLEPLLLGFADLLLRQASDEKDPEQISLLLLEAQNTVELVKTAELQDYFLDTCAATQRPLMDLEQIAEGTVVIYPILFKDRLEVLYGMGRQIKRVTVPVKKRRLERSVKRVVSSLRLSPGRQLARYQQKLSSKIYGWLIEPLEEYLRENKIHTLVYVPDGILRTLPISALWDKNDKKFLIEKYAVATTPGLTLMDPKPTDRSTLVALLAGVSRPGSVVEELPASMKLSLTGLPVVESGNNDLRQKDASVENEKLKNALALPGVIREIDELSTRIRSRKLLDEDFLVEKFEKEMGGNYRIVHIASHGFFTGSAEESFIMAYDKLLDMNKLEALFKSEAFSDAPVELLTLSACQTAEGDDRSPLGLSGIALKSGARCALGSLWPVSDEATQQLLPDFYTNLSDSGLSKAQALQKAQIKLLKQDRFRHPSLWAAFILVGNWL